LKYFPAKNNNKPFSSADQNESSCKRDDNLNEELRKKTHDNLNKTFVGGKKSNFQNQTSQSQPRGDASLVCSAINRNTTFSNNLDHRLK
jgi:hypothetical protein